MDYADHHSGTLGSSRVRMNPYKLGVELFRDIEDRWDKGRFGKEYEECDDVGQREQWDQKNGSGQGKDCLRCAGSTATLHLSTPS